MVFGATALVASVMEMILVSLLTWRILPPWPGLFEFALATGAYPFLSLYLTFLHRGAAAPERAA
jgi:hypothetical protein